MRPISVRIPVACTTNSARPRETTVFIRTVPPAPRATGRLSPVRVASSTSRWLAATRRPSAGIRSPASTNTRSPGTSVLLSTICIRRRAARESARPAWNAARRATARLGVPAGARRRRSRRRHSVRRSGVFNSPDTMNEMAAAASNTRVSVPVNWASNRLQPGTFGAAASSLGPCSVSSAAASADESPGGVRGVCKGAVGGTWISFGARSGR